MRMVRVYLSMTASCGAFVICVGLGLIAGGLSARLIYPALAVGFGSGFIVMILAAIMAMRMGLGKPSLLQRLTPSICAIVEIIVFMALAPLIPPDARTLFIVVLAIVGVHFLPMMVSFGPLVGVLGVACGWRSLGDTGGTARSDFAGRWRPKSRLWLGYAGGALFPSSASRFGLRRARGSAFSARCRSQPAGWPCRPTPA